MRIPLLFVNPGVRTGRIFQLDEVILLDWLVDGSISERDPNLNACVCYRGYSRSRTIGHLQKVQWRSFVGDFYRYEIRRTWLKQMNG